MLYRYSLTIPADTSLNNPVVQEFKIGAGILHWISIAASDACEHYVYFSIYCGSHQVFPSNPYEKFRPGAAPIEKEDHVVNLAGWHWFMVGSSPDSRYDHTVDLRVGILPDVLVSPERIGETLLKMFTTTPELGDET